MFIGTGTQIDGVREGSGGEQVEGVGIETGGAGGKCEAACTSFFLSLTFRLGKVFSPEQDGNLGW